MIKFPNYCSIADIDDRLSHLYHYITFTVIPETKHKHNINGWVCIAGVLPDGRIEKLHDVWSGFNNEFLGGIVYNINAYNA